MTTATQLVRPGSRARLARIAVALGGTMLLLAFVAELTGSPELTSSGTFRAAFRLAVPILFAGLGGLFAERAGVINIGLEGMMILGTWFAAWGAWMYGPWWGIVLALVGGALGGLLHAIATVTFGIDHIVSGVAINILAGGVARFLSVITYPPGSGGGATQSPRVVANLGSVGLPFLSGGTVFGWRSPDLFGWLEGRRIFLLSDVSGLARGITGDISWLMVFAIAVVPLTFWFLWRTSLGLRLRSVGEHPVAAESLGVPVYTMKYLALIISGGLAGLGGAALVLEFAGIYREGQTGGRGFIGLAAMIFGNWRPGGVASAAGLFGYASALQLRQEEAVHGLLLAVALGLVVVAVVAALRRNIQRAVVMALIAVGFFVWFVTTDSVPREFLFFTPHVTTLLVLAFFAQRLRMPAADGMRYRKGQSQ